MQSVESTETQVEKKGFREKFKDFKVKMNHNRMLMFGVQFFAVIGILIILSASIIGVYIDKQRIKLTDDAMYNTEFVTSRTNHKGVVNGIYTNDAYTKALILFKFEDMKDMSSNVNDYSAYIISQTGNTQTVPAGNIYMFGTTGYMGIYLVDKSGFVPDKWDVIVQCKKEYTETSIDGKKFDSADYVNNDLLKITCNVGAKNTTKLALLNQDKEFKPSDVYGETIVQIEEFTFKDTMVDTLTKMESLYKLITDEYTNRLKLSMIVVPELPKEIAGDKYVPFEYTDADGKKVEVEDLPVLKTDYIFPGGHMLDVYGTDILSGGYLSDLTGSSNLREWQTYLRNINATIANDKPSISLPAVYYYEDGTIFNFEENTTTLNSDRATNEAIQQYNSSLTEYYKMKYDYQVNQMKKLLEMELSVRDADNQFTKSDDDSKAINFVK